MISLDVKTNTLSITNDAQSMVFAKTPAKIIPKNQMHMKPIRRKVYEITRMGNSVLEVGSGTGAMALDFSINTGGKRICMVDADVIAYDASLKNAYANNVKNFEVHWCTGIWYALMKANPARRFDSIILGSRGITPLEIEWLIKNCLNRGGRLIGFIREDVAHYYMMGPFKLIIQQCNIESLDFVIDPNDGYMRLVFSAVRP